MAKPYVPYDGPIVTRKEAIELGLARYFTGKPCKHGHLSEKQTSCHKCVECQRINDRQSNAYREKKRREALVESGVAESLKAFVTIKEARSIGLTRYFTGKMCVNGHIEERTVCTKRCVQCVRDRISKSRKKNPEKSKARCANRRALKSGAKGKYTAEDVQRIGKSQKWKCANCKNCIKLKYHVDHIVPLSKGGSNYPKNLELLCPKCNTTKKDKMPLDWALQNGRLV